MYGCMYIFNWQMLGQMRCPKTSASPRVLGVFDALVLPAAERQRRQDAAA